MSSVRNGTEGPDLSMVGGLWAQYQSALAMSNPMKLDGSASASSSAAAALGLGGNVSGGSSALPSLESPTRHTDQPMCSPPNLGENPDESSSSGHKDDDDGDDDDDSDDRMDTNTPHDPERLKAFNVSSSKARQSDLNLQMYS